MSKRRERQDALAIAGDRDQPFHVASQVSTYLRVGIFAENQGGAGMVDKYIA